MSKLRSFARKLPVVGDLGRAYRDWERHRSAAKVFSNPDLLVRAMRKKNPDLATLTTKSGLKVRFRQNIFDAIILREVFLEREYLRRVQLPANPVIIDIGGYIGDFAIYAAHYLKAKVAVYEPVAENFAVLKENIRINALEDRVSAYPLAVSEGNSVTLHIQKAAAGEVHASRHDYKSSEARVVRAIKPEEIFASVGFDQVDLLKIDCEGGEYEIFPLLKREILDRCRCIVFEHHPVVADWKQRVEQIFRQLRDAGFTLIEDGMVVSAVRQ